MTNNSLENKCPRGLVLAAMALSGAAALTYETVSSKFFSYFFGSSTYAVSTMLVSFLFGLALGSFLMSRLIKKIKDRRNFFAIIQFIIGAYAVLILVNFNQFSGILEFVYQVFGSGIFLLTLGKFLVGSLYLLLPTLLLGAAFPLAGSLLIKDTKRAGRDIGTLYSLDTWGAILGALAAGFFLVPLLGLKYTVLIGGLMNLMSGFLIVRKNVREVSYLFTGAVVLVIIFSLLSGGSIPLFAGVNSALTSSGGKVVFEKNSPYGVVAVLEWEDEEGSVHRHLSIDGRGMCETGGVAAKELPHMILANFDKPVDVLNIGAGCGHTVQAILEHDKAKTIDAIEINPSVVKAARDYFGEDTGYSLDNERTNLMVEDAVKFLLTTDKTYDAIIVTVENSGVTYSSPLYTVDYFKIIKSRLRDGGIFGIISIFNDYEYVRDLYRSLEEVFSYVYVTREFGNIPKLIASQKALDVEKIKSNLNFPGSDTFNGFDENLMGKINNDPNYSINTLDNPILEYFGLEKMKEWDLLLKQ